MLPKENRLRKSAEFTSVFRGGKSSGNYLLTMHVIPVAEDTKADLPKVGFVVGKRVGNSVVRHQVIRKLRHIMREYLPVIKAQALVVRARPAAATADYQQLQAAIEKELRKLSLIPVAGKAAEKC